MLKYVLTVPLLFIFFSCSKLNFDSNRINELKIKNTRTKLVQTISDKKVIDLLFDKYINNNEEYLVEFKGRNHLIFNYKNKEIILITNGEYIRCQNKTYRLKNNVNEFFKQVNISIPEY